MAPTSGLIRAKQAERLIASLRPPAIDQAPPIGHLAEIIPLPSLTRPVPAEHDHRVVLLDDHGRIREASLWADLGWGPGTRVTIEEETAHLVVRADAAGPVQLDAKGRLRIPHALRAIRDWGAGHSVLLSVPRGKRVLIVHSTSILDTLVVNHVN